MNGSAIPEVDFDIGESYAGLMPISKAANETRELYFWFFPSENTEASDEILIWLNGGVSFATTWKTIAVICVTFSEEFRIQSSIC